MVLDTTAYKTSFFERQVNVSHLTKSSFYQSSRVNYLFGLSSYWTRSGTFATHRTWTQYCSLHKMSYSYLNLCCRYHSCEQTKSTANFSKTYFVSWGQDGYKMEADSYFLYCTHKTETSSRSKTSRLCIFVILYTQISPGHFPTNVYFEDILSRDRTVSTQLDINRSTAFDHLNHRSLCSVCKFTITSNHHCYSVSVLLWQLAALFV